MTWKKGQSGNLAGKPKGTRNRTTVACEALFDGEGEKLSRKAIEMALKGDPTMLRLCLERVIPPRKDRPINFDLPPLVTTQDASLALRKIMEDVAAGKLTPDEGETVSAIIEHFADTVRLNELEARIAEMEARR